MLAFYLINYLLLYMVNVLMSRTISIVHVKYDESICSKCVSLSKYYIFHLSIAFKIKHLKFELSNIE